jgi:hypothetical protein
MTDDYLLQEFHEAGIWLPGEREAVIRSEESSMEAFIRIQIKLQRQIDDQSRGPTLIYVQ